MISHEIVVIPLRGVLGGDQVGDLDGYLSRAAVDVQSTESGFAGSDPIGVASFQAGDAVRRACSDMEPFAERVRINIGINRRIGEQFSALYLHVEHVGLQAKRLNRALGIERIDSFSRDQETKPVIEQADLADLCLVEQVRIQWITAPIVVIEQVVLE